MLFDRDSCIAGEMPLHRSLEEKKKGNGARVTRRL